MTDTATCRRCGGRIFRMRRPIRHPRGPWLHARPDDWGTAPHEAEPRDHGGATGHTHA